MPLLTGAHLIDVVFLQCPCLLKPIYYILCFAMPLLTEARLIDVVFLQCPLLTEARLIDVVFLQCPC